ncbi:hypothetical protein NDU88_007913 [Pleurodeles waltl]|uniref:Uncharacterized protein n=1 Tax=Pleurodeles waltl TaxID=8319 RepID=A0AAV7PV77_PLEWA|nr:hypothetical protein NDU88_007913 [Pleurodeles waltl]
MSRELYQLFRADGRTGRRNSLCSRLVQLHSGSEMTVAGDTPVTPYYTERFLNRNRSVTSKIMKSLIGLVAKARQMTCRGNSSCPES